MKPKKRYDYYFPENLKYLCLLSSFNRQFLASLTGYSVQYIVMMLTGKRRIPKHLVPLFELLLGLIASIELYSKKQIVKDKKQLLQQ